MSENGYGLLIAWAAGPRRTIRVTATSEDYPLVKQETRVPGADPAPGHRARTADEQAEVDDDIDEYLRAAGVPPHPRGYIWLVQVHAGDSDPGRALGATDSVEPAAVLKELRDRYEQYSNRSN